MGQLKSMQPEHLDVVIVGAGLSGIGAACHLTEKCPQRNYTLLESRAAIGGTWDLFRYPGIRSDSDMHTLGYSFKPWEGAKAIADGASILEYVRQTADQHDVYRKVRFGQTLVAANWCSRTSCWTLKVAQKNAVDITLSCNFLYMCSGYYSYQQAHDPQLPNIKSFAGRVVHPQFWPEDIDYRDKKVVIIGSGATAVTLLPAMAETAASVVMLQRSPSYVISRPSEDWFANTLRKLLPATWAYSLTRKRNTLYQEALYKFTRYAPQFVKKGLLAKVRNELGDAYDVDRHFTPSYNPWDQRLCLVPDGDLFAALRAERASVVTDQIEYFTQTGLQLVSGDHLDADIVVTATGLKLVVHGGAAFSVDDEVVDFAKLWTYKGLMVSDVPNMVSTFGYVNASWTLRADLIAEWVCRTLNYMTATESASVVPRVPEALLNMPSRDWIDSFSAGYISRVMHLFPQQGDSAPWINPQDLRADRKLFKQPLESDSALQFKV